MATADSPDHVRACFEERLGGPTGASERQWSWTRRYRRGRGKGGSIVTVQSTNVAGPPGTAGPLPDGTRTLIVYHQLDVPS